VSSTSSHWGSFSLQSPLLPFCRPYLVVPAGYFYAESVHAIYFILAVTFPVFALKQFISVIQLATSAARIVELDDASRRKAQA
jgi:hypothetical protein